MSEQRGPEGPQAAARGEGTAPEPLRLALHEARHAALATFAAHLRADWPDVPARLRAVHRACRLTGFLPEAPAIRPIPLESPHGPLLVVLNPHRARPHAAHPLPPPAPRSPCPLCDLPWSQLWLELELDGEGWRAAPSPAPYLPAPQWTVATTTHRLQEPADDRDARHLFAAMAGLLARAPGLLLGWNGAGAGASLPAHRHFHALGEEVGQVLPSPSPTAAHILALEGEGMAVAAELAAALMDWRRELGPWATANVIMWGEEGRIQARFVRRDRRREQLDPLPEVRAGFLEAGLHTVILKSSQTITAFEQGRLPAAVLARALTELAPAPVRD